MSIPQFEEIVETNDQTEARREHLEKLRELVGNVYPNKFVRSSISGSEDTISALIAYEPVAELAAEMAAVKASLKEGERPPADMKDAINAKLKEFGNVRIAGRLAVPPRVMGKAAFVHLSDGISRLQIYVKRDDVQAISTKAEPPASAGGKMSADESIAVNAETSPPAYASGSASGWEVFQLLDHGDFVGVEGYLFVTNTGEVSVHVEKLQFLAKAMLPMPDKMHGIADAEIKQRQRYVDLIGSSLQVKAEPPASAGGATGNEPGADGVNSPSTTLPPAYAGGTALSTREVFERRAKIISSMRRYLEDHGYIEVETPMLTAKATGAAAKPFKTHHNALDIDLYARIAPELYLKRLVVGGFEKVYELNRNFRNEGISYKHNPEFTMLEFYCAYMDVNGMMDFCEEMFRESVLKATGGLTVNYEGKEIDFSKFERISMKEAVGKYWRHQWKKVDEHTPLRRLAAFSYLVEIGDGVPGIYAFPRSPEEAAEREKLERPDRIETAWEYSKNFIDSLPNDEDAKVNRFFSALSAFRTMFDLDGSEENLNAQFVQHLFETYGEGFLIGPTFIIDYPKSISPLSKASPENPQIAERFELFINGMEVANGFSELNDPKEQYDRFVDQMSERERGDEEAMILDEDYIRALSYGMPPAAGIGIGIDRLVMLLTNKHSIRDVILFPHMRPEKNTQETEE